MAKIYKITNCENNKVYIGCTIKTLKERLDEHVYRAISGNHNTKLYNSFRKYGIECFTMELIIECDENEMFEKEIEYIKQFDSFQNGLNSTLGGEGCLGYKHTDETKIKISNIIKNGKSHKNKTYEQIYGDKCEEQKQIRSEKTKIYWSNLDDKSKQEIISKINNRKRKYSTELILEILNKFNTGYTVKQIKAEYPQISIYYLYDLKKGRRGKSTQN